METNKEGGCVDAETKLALQEMKNEIIDAVKLIVDERTRDLEKYITSINEPRFDNLEKSIERHDNYHKDHYTEIKQIDEKITMSRQSIIKEVKGDSRFSTNTVMTIISLFIAAGAIIISMVVK